MAQILTSNVPSNFLIEERGEQSQTSPHWHKERKLSSAIPTNPHDETMSYRARDSGAWCWPFLPPASLIGLMVLPASVTTFGLAKPRAARIPFHSFPMGTAKLRSYCSRLVKGYGTCSTFSLAAAFTRFWLIITRGNDRSVRREEEDAGAPPPLLLGCSLASL